MTWSDGWPDDSATMCDKCRNGASPVQEVFTTDLYERLHRATVIMPKLNLMVKGDLLFRRRGQVAGNTRGPRRVRLLQRPSGQAAGTLRCRWQDDPGRPPGCQLRLRLQALHRLLASDAGCSRPVRQPSSPNGRCNDDPSRFSLRVARADVRSGAQLQRVRLPVLGGHALRTSRSRSSTGTRPTRRCPCHTPTVPLMEYYVKADEGPQWLGLQVPRGRQALVADR